MSDLQRLVTLWRARSRVYRTPPISTECLGLAMAYDDCADDVQAFLDYRRELLEQLSIEDAALLTEAMADVDQALDALQRVSAGAR